MQSSGGRMRSLLCLRWRNIVLMYIGSTTTLLQDIYSRTFSWRWHCGWPAVIAYADSQGSFPLWLLLYFGITELSRRGTMTTVTFSVWFVQACVFSQEVVSSLVRGQGELSKLAENGEWEVWCFLSPSSPAAEAVCEREGKQQEQQWRGSSWYPSTLPSSQTTAGERMELCKNVDVTRGQRPTLILPGQVPAGVWSSHHEIPSSLVVCHAQGQSRKNLQLCSHEEGLKDPWKPYWFGLLINGKQLPCHGWFKGTVLPLVGLSLWVSSADPLTAVSTALWPGDLLHGFKAVTLIWSSKKVMSIKSII